MALFIINIEVMCKKTTKNRTFVAVEAQSRLYRLYCDDIRKLYKRKTKRTPPLPK